MSKETNSFKKNFPFEKRLSESSRILEKYENRIPVIVTNSKKSTLPDIDKNKILVPDDLTIAQFLYVIRKRISLSQAEALYLCINDETLPPTSVTMSSLYADHKDSDGFLYLTYCNENVFG